MGAVRNKSRGELVFVMAADSPQAERLEQRRLLQSRAVAAGLNLEVQPRAVRKFHFRDQAQPFTGLDGFDAPAVHGVARGQGVDSQVARVALQPARTSAAATTRISSAIHIPFAARL